MKGKRHATEQKIRILREADGGKTIVEVCKEHNISEVTFHRWKRQFGQLDVNEARRMKELERENAELKKMLADALLKNRVLEAVNAKNGEPGTQAADGLLPGRRRPVFRADCLSVAGSGAVDFSVSNAASDGGAHPSGETSARAVAQVSARRVPAHCREVAPGRLQSWPQAGAETAASRRTAGATAPAACAPPR